VISGSGPARVDIRQRAARLPEWARWRIGKGGKGGKGAATAALCGGAPVAVA
jgi:hypothetical protein